MPCSNSRVCVRVRELLLRVREKHRELNVRRRYEELDAGDMQDCGSAVWFPALQEFSMLSESSVSAVCAAKGIEHVTTCTITFEQSCSLVVPPHIVTTKLYDSSTSTARH